MTTKRGRGGGTFVRTGRGPDADGMIARTLVPAWTDLTELLDFRLLVEQLIARTAADRRDDRDITAIRAAVQAYNAARTAMPRGSPTMRLHRAIALATHNARLVELSAQTRREVSLGFNAEPYSPQVRNRALHQHPSLAEAIISGDADRAAQLAAEHFALTEEMLRELHARIRLRSEGDLDGRDQR